MAKCNFCKNRFQSEQGVKAHMKTCEIYLTEKAKKGSPSGSLPQAPAGLDLSAPNLDIMKLVQAQLSKQKTPPTSQHQQRTILQEVKVQVIDRYVTSLGRVTSSMRGHIKLLIEKQLATLPLEELGFEEACEIAAAIRDRLYALAFTKQERDAKRQRVEAAANKKREVETLSGLLRASRRKNMFCQQRRQHAHAFCLEKEITRWAQLSIISDVESRLDVFLTGDEPILEGQAIVRSVLESRFAEAEVALAAMRAKSDAQWREDMATALVFGALVGLVGVSLWYPEQTVAFFDWLEETFGVGPGATTSASNSEASETPSATASAETAPRHARRRKSPVSPPDSPFPYAPTA